MFEPINRKAPEDRRPVPLKDGEVVKQGQIVSLDPVTGKAVLADGAAFVPDPMWSFTASSRLDSATAKSLTVLEAPFIARVGADGHAGTIAAGNALKIGTSNDKGKLVAEATVDTVEKLQNVVAYAIKAPDSDSVLLFKAVR